MSAEPRRVLLVDDDDDLRGLVRAVLAANPALEVVGEAGDGESALAQAAEHEPDIVVLDLGLPDLAGREVLTRLRALQSSIRVVVFTADEAARREVQELGAAGFVSKAEELSRLVGVLEAVEADDDRDPDRSAATNLGAETTSAGTARRFVSAFLSQFECDHVVDDAVLLVSELVTNAVVHAGTTSELRLQLFAGVLRIEVSDGGPGTPDPRSPAMDEAGGRGLQIVSALASAWGIDPTPTGKRVWAEVAT